jgi:hypothetical protein
MPMSKAEQKRLQSLRNEAKSVAKKSINLANKVDKELKRQMEKS